MISSKTLLSALVVVWMSFTAGAGERQKVHSIVKQYQTTEWYAEQAKLWKAQLAETPKDSDAWLNYYTAERMLKINRAGITQSDLDAIVEKMEKAIPDSFVFHYVSYWNSGHTGSDKEIEHLFRAQELEPNNPNLFDDLLSYYEIRRDKKNTKRIAERWFASNDMANGLYYWNYNMIQSTEPDAILITVGDNDTYPALVLQHAAEVRTDVDVLNIYLLTSDSYRKLVFEELGIPAFVKSKSDYPSEMEFLAAICKHIKNNSSRPFYYGVSASPKLYESVKDDVYNVGMAFQWCDKKFDNIAVIKKNYEKHFLLDYLQLSVGNNISEGVINHMNANYLSSMLTLYNHYKESEDPKAGWLKTLITDIAKKANVADRVAALLHKEEFSATSMVIKDAKTILKQLVKVNDTLYAGAEEVNNGQYNLFLTDLMKQRRFDDLNTARLFPVKWDELVDAEEVPDEGLFPHGDPLDDLFPVCNLSYEAAQQYCAWLTHVYNSLEHRKNAPSRVLFRLPTESEWEYLASAGGKHSPYPWDGPYIRNARGCFLANIQTKGYKGPEASSTPKTEITSCAIDDDGGVFPVLTNSYMPNDFGLFNTCGNVAEMVAEKGRSKGGSWNTPPGEAYISASQPTAGPSPEVGFRIVMIVLE